MAAECTRTTSFENFAPEFPEKEVRNSPQPPEQLSLGLPHRLSSDHNLTTTNNR
jgi:hypothetical protein